MEDDTNSNMAPIFDSLTFVSLGLEDDVDINEDDNDYNHERAEEEEVKNVVLDKSISGHKTEEEEEEEEFVLIESSEGAHAHYSDIMANYGQKYYSLVHQQDVFLHGSFVETVIPFTRVPHILSTQCSPTGVTRHAPYGTYRILIQLASVLHVRSFEHLASVTICFSPNNHSTIVVDEKVPLLRSEHFNSDSAFWMSSPIRVPSLYCEQTGDLWNGVTVSLIPVKQSVVVMQPKYKFIIRLISESEIHSQATLTIPPHSSTPVTLDATNNNNNNNSTSCLSAESLGAYTIVVTDKRKSGQVVTKSHNAMGAIMGDWLSHMGFHHSPQYQVVIKSDAINVHDEMGREFMTPLFPVYKYHLGFNHRMSINCTIKPLQKTGRKPTNISILLLKVPFSEERVRECEIISSTTHVIVASLEQYKDGQILEDNLPILNKYLELESFHSSFLQADPVATRMKAIAIVEQKNQLLSRVRQLESFCNRRNYEDSCESSLETLRSDLSKFQFEFKDLKEAQHLVKQLTQRMALRRQLNQRLSYVQNMIVGYNGVLSTMTIDIIYREDKVLQDLYQALTRAFNGDFSVCEAVAKDVELLESFIAVLEARRQELLRLALIQREQLEKSKNQPEQHKKAPRVEVEVVASEAVEPSVITELDGTVAATTDIMSVSADLSEDVVSERTENDLISVSEETTDRSDNIRTEDLRTEDEHNNSSLMTDEEAKKKKKKKKKRVANIEDRVVTESSPSPTQVLQQGNSGRGRSLSSLSLPSNSTQHVDPVPSPLFSSLDNGQVIHEMHQCLKQLMRIGAANSTTTTTTTSMDDEISRLQIPKDNTEAQNLIDNFVYLVVRYVLLNHRIPRKAKWFGKKAAENEQFFPAISIIRGMGDQCQRYLEQFEASVEQTVLQEEAACEQLVRWSLGNHALPIIMKSLLTSTKYVSKFYTKSSLLVSPSFQDEFICVLELLSQMQL